MSVRSISRTFHPSKPVAPITASRSYRCHAFLFDSHNHVHLSMPGGIPTLSDNSRAQNSDDDDDDDIANHAIQIYNSTLDSCNIPRMHEEERLGGMAIMSTQPRDFPIVDKISFCIENEFRKTFRNNLTDTSADTAADMSSTQNNPSRGLIMIRCYGVHPWFLHEADAEFEQRLSASDSDPRNDHDSSDIQSRGTATSQNNRGTTEHTRTKPTTTTTPNDETTLLWLPYLRAQLTSSKHSCVGEIGLDGARYDPITRDLPTPMERQVRAFEAQMHLAADLEKCVSLHAVKAWGPLMDSIRRIKADRKRRRDLWRNEDRLTRQRGGGGMACVGSERGDVGDDGCMRGNETGVKEPLLLPPRIYFHAFGGKVDMVNQLDALCCDRSQKKNGSVDANPSSGTTALFFGFAPCINFRSPKTVDLIRKVGIGRLVLESDLEDHRTVMRDLDANVDFVAKALGVGRDVVLKATYENALRLYGVPHYNDDR